MKYYKIRDKSLDLEQKERGLVADIPCVNGEFVPNGKKYFEQMGAMGKPEVIHDAPVFDYFHLESFGPKEEWEWRLQDVHRGIGTYPLGGYWYISDKSKKLFEQFYIAPQYYFYATKLLYKGKCDYWIFQFPINPQLNVDFTKLSCSILDDPQHPQIGFLDFDDFLVVRRRLRKELNQKIKLDRLSLIDNYDFVYNLIEGDRLVSEKMASAIKAAGLQGFVFSELDYEVEVLNQAVG